MLDVATVIDFSGSLSILGMLAAAYGGLYRLLPDKRFFGLALGTLFGLVAFVQMHNPVEPHPGVLVDMRNVPIVLAGAFLGARGLLPCLLIALLTRLGIGGVGTFAGIVALITSGGIGLTWKYVTHGTNRRGLSLAVLGLAVSVHTWAIVFLPFDLAILLMREAVPVLVIMNLVSVFLVGTLLNRERRQIEREETLTRDADFMLGNRLMGRGALDWSLTQAAATGSLRDGALIVAVRIRFKGALARLLGDDADHLAIKVLHDRLASIMPVGGVVGWARTDLVVMAIPRTDADDARALLTRIRRDVSGAPIFGRGLAPFRLVLDLDVEHYDALPPFDRLLSDLSATALPDPAMKSGPFTAGAPVGRTWPHRQEWPSKGHFVRHGGDLFSTFDKLRDARFGT